LVLVITNYSNLNCKDLFIICSLTLSIVEICSTYIIILKSWCIFLIKVQECIIVMSKCVVLHYKTAKLSGYLKNYKFFIKNVFIKLDYSYFYTEKKLNFKLFSIV